MSAVDRLLRGALDLHVHNGPDVIPRVVDAWQAAEQAREAGMGGVLLKSKRYPTYPLAWALQQRYSDLATLGGIVLDNECGGLNALAVENAARLGAKICWMPCFSSSNDVRKLGLEGPGIDIVDENGRLLPVAKRICDIAREHGMVLATGHMALEQIMAMLDYTCSIGMDRVIATHVMDTVVGCSATIEQQVEMARRGACIEHCYLTTRNDVATKILETLFPGKQLQHREFDVANMVEAIKAVGPERCIISTDCGNAYGPAPIEGMRRFMELLLDHGISEGDIGLMAKSNPAKLMGMQ